MLGVSKAKCEIVVGWKLTLFALVVFECLEAGEGGTSSNHFMAEARLVLFEVVVLVDLLVSVFVVIWGSVSCCYIPQFTIRRCWPNVPQKPIVIYYECLSCLKSFEGVLDVK
jgi:hypothetical protein